MLENIDSMIMTKFAMKMEYSRVIISSFSYFINYRIGGHYRSVMSQHQLASKLGIPLLDVNCITVIPFTKKGKETTAFRSSWFRSFYSGIPERI